MFKDFLWKSDPLEHRIPVFLNMWVSPGVYLTIVSAHFKNYFVANRMHENPIHRVCNRCPDVYTKPIQIMITPETSPLYIFLRMKHLAHTGLSGFESFTFRPWSMATMLLKGNKGIENDLEYMSLQSEHPGTKTLNLIATRLKLEKLHRLEIRTGRKARVTNLGCSMIQEIIRLYLISLKLRKHWNFKQTHIRLGRN